MQLGNALHPLAPSPKFLLVLAPNIAQQVPLPYTLCALRSPFLPPAGPISHNPSHLAALNTPSPPSRLRPPPCQPSHAGRYRCPAQDQVLAYLARHFRGWLV